MGPDGLVAVMPPGPAAKESDISRWPMSLACVSAPGATRRTALIDAASGVLIWKPWL